MKKFVYLLHIRLYKFRKQTFTICPKNLRKKHNSKGTKNVFDAINVMTKKKSSTLCFISAAT